MGGLALGAWLAGYVQAASLRAYAALELLVAATALLLPLALSSATPALAGRTRTARRRRVSRSFASSSVSRFSASPPPRWVRLSDRGRLAGVARQGRASFSGAGSLYASNTAGAALGALAAGFWLIPDARPSRHDLGRRRT
jgi:hypothetical protein